MQPLKGMKKRSIEVLVWADDNVGIGTKAVDAWVLGPLAVHRTLSRNPLYKPDTVTITHVGTGRSVGPPVDSYSRARRIVDALKDEDWSHAEGTASGISKQIVLAAFYPDEESSGRQESSGREGA